MTATHAVQARAAADGTLVLQRMLEDRRAVPTAPARQLEKGRILDGQDVSAIMGRAGIRSPAGVPHIWSLWQATSNVKTQHSDLKRGMDT